MSSKICAICNKECTSKLMSHVKRIHKLSTKEYYDLYLKKDTDGICPICGKTTTFIKNYYNKCCSQSHSALYRKQCSNRLNDIHQFEIDNNCTSISTLRDLYGQGWYKAKIIPETAYIKESFGTTMFFIDNQYIDMIINYNNSNLNSGKSHKELELQQYIEQIYKYKIYFNNKKVIYPKELDIYLPDVKIGIEFNGNYYHSIDNLLDKNYHINKSILCKERNIRLIHIYEFEDFEEQKQLLYELLVNQNDMYDKRDFNKNNLIHIQVEPVKYVVENKYTIYTAGPLYNTNKGEKE